MSYGWRQLNFWKAVEIHYIALLLKDRGIYIFIQVIFLL